MIRYYERIGLIPRAGRTDAGYRVYTASEVHVLHFVHRAREFGFPLELIRVLVSLWQGKRPSRDESAWLWSMSRTSIDGSRNLPQCVLRSRNS